MTRITDTPAFGDINTLSNVSFIVWVHKIVETAVPKLVGVKYTVICAVHNSAQAGISIKDEAGALRGDGDIIEQGFKGYAHIPWIDYRCLWLRVIPFLICDL